MANIKIFMLLEEQEIKLVPDPLERESKMTQFRSL